MESTQHYTSMVCTMLILLKYTQSDISYSKNFKTHHTFVTYLAQVHIMMSCRFIVKTAVNSIPTLSSSTVPNEPVLVLYPPTTPSCMTILIASCRDCFRALALRESTPETDAMLRSRPTCLSSSLQKYEQYKNLFKCSAESFNLLYVTCANLLFSTIFGSVQNI